jgi:hypothetical protein
MRDARKNFHPLARQSQFLFRYHAAFGDEARGFRDRFGEQPASGEVPALCGIRLAIARP